MAKLRVEQLGQELATAKLASERKDHYWPRCRLRMRRKIVKIQAANKDKDRMSEKKDRKLVVVIDSKQNVPRKITNSRMLPRTSVS